MNKKVLSPPMDVRPVAERRYAVRMLTAPMKSGLGSSQNNIVEGMQLSASRTARKRCVNGCDLSPPGDVPPVIGFTGPMGPTCTRSLGVQSRAQFNAILGAIGGRYRPLSLPAV